MSNQLEKLKNSIKTEYVEKFEFNLMKSSGFIPVDKRQNNIYVILNKNNAKNKTEISSVIQNKFAGLTPQFIPIDVKDFESILKTYEKSSSTNTALSSVSNTCFMPDGIL